MHPEITLHFCNKEDSGGTAELSRLGRKFNLSNWCSGKGHIDVVAQEISLGIALSISTKKQTIPA